MRPAIKRVVVVMLLVVGIAGVAIVGVASSRAQKAAAELAAFRPVAAVTADALRARSMAVADTPFACRQKLNPENLGRAFFGEVNFVGVADLSELGEAPGLATFGTWYGCGASPENVLILGARYGSIGAQLKEMFSMAPGAWWFESVHLPICLRSGETDVKVWALPQLQLEGERAVGKVMLTVFKLEGDEVLCSGAVPVALKAPTRSNPLHRELTDVVTGVLRAAAQP